MKRSLAAQRMGRGGAKRGAVVHTKTVQAPIGGLNTRDAVADMEEADAVILDNFVPGPSDVGLRRGYQAWATNINAPVQGLLAYRGPAQQQLFAFAGDKAYDVTLSNPAGAPVLTGLTDGRFVGVNFGTPGGHFLYAVNDAPADKALLYDGAKWRRMDDGAGQTIASITHSGTTATLTTTAPHGLATGDEIAVTGATPAEFNVAAQAITVTSPTSFTYALASAPASDATVMGSYAQVPNVTGCDTSLFINVAVFGHRVWFTERNSFRAWYLPLNSIGGALTPLDLSSLFELGGSLAGVFNWTIVAEQATIQYAAFISTEGEMAIFEGYDPSNAATWALAGIARVGRPVGRKFAARVGSDMVLLTADGFVPMSKAVMEDRTSQSDALSYKISPSVIQDVRMYGANDGWQAILYPIGNLLIFNVPTREDANARQYVMNTLTNAWCRYIGLDALCWETLGDDIFFGDGLGTVHQAEKNYTDDGAAITGIAKPAYSYFGMPGIQKRFSMARPTMTADGNVAVSLSLQLDFADAPTGPTALLDPNRPALTWDFDWDSQWSDVNVVTSVWHSIGGVGMAASAKLQGTSLGAALRWQATTYVFEAGGIL